MYYYVSAFIIYYLFFGLACQFKGKEYVILGLGIIPLFLLVVFRGNVGTDTYTYLNYFDQYEIYGNSGGFEPVFYWLSAVLMSIFDNARVVMALIGILITVILFYSSFRIEKNGFIFGSVVIPYFYISMVMNGIRYGLAFSLVVLAASYLLKRQKWRFWLISIIAGLSHLSAFVLVFLFYIQLYLKKRLPTVVLIVGGMTGVIVFFFYGYLVAKFNAYENFIPPSGLSGLAPFIISLCTLMIWFFDIQLRKNKQAIFSLFLLVVLSYALAQITYAGLRFQFLVIFMLVLSIQFQMDYWDIKLGKKAAYMAIFTGFIGLMSQFRNMLDEYGSGESPFLPYVFFGS